MPNPLPEDPIIRSLVQRARQAPVSRRRLLQGAGLGAALLGASGLAACSSKKTYGDGSKGTIRWANWTYYLDFDEKTKDYPTLNDFMEKTDIAVDYYEDIDDNKTFIAKIKDQLQLGQDTGYDVFVPSDTTIVRLVEKDQLRKFDRSLVPNVGEQMIDLVKHATFDPDRIMSIPYQAGMTGLVYNTKLYPKGIKRVSDLWAPELKGKVNLLSEQDDTTGLIMLEQGVDIVGDKWGDDQFYAALDVVKKQLAKGQVATIKGNSYTQDLQQEKIWAGMCWSGDIAILNEEAGEEIWKFVVPESGASVFIDSFSMPKATESYKQVHELVNYYYEPEVAARVAQYVQYVTPVAGARDAMAKLDPKLADNPLIFPDEEMSKHIFDMRSLTAQEDDRYTKAFQKVMGN
ncbi:spermidine/putrescine ABC transporter substrate-binding protein [Leucobacter iarius]|uniref:Spermidine/putrescine ABC transporter substrate-binding protein n=1 Tax=Leucobacter iarius TaxID=333963 RepID=A0ABP4XL65_9MICO